MHPRSTEMSNPFSIQQLLIHIRVCAVSKQESRLDLEIADSLILIDGFELNRQDRFVMTKKLGHGGIY